MATPPSNQGHGSAQNFNVRQGPQSPREWPDVGEATHTGGDAYRDSKIFIGGDGNPTETVTVSGHISGTGVIFTSAGYSGDWNSTYATVIVVHGRSLVSYQSLHL